MKGKCQGGFCDRESEYIFLQVFEKDTCVYKVCKKCANVYKNNGSIVYIALKQKKEI